MHFTNKPKVDVLIADDVQHSNKFGEPYFRKYLERCPPYSFFKLSHDEASVAYESIHRHSTSEVDVPLGVRSFSDENFAFWGRCAKGHLAQLRFNYALLKEIDVCHDNGGKYAIELKGNIAEARKGFRNAMIHRRNKRFLCSAKDLSTQDWQLAVYSFCQFLLAIQNTRCDPNFVGQMIDQIITPAYESINSTYLFEKNSMEERRKLKLVAAFVLERRDDYSAFGYRFDFERCFNIPEVTCAADNLQIRHILDAMRDRFSA